MGVGFAPGAENLRLPWGTPQPLPFHDGELDLDLALRARGFVEGEPPADEESEEWNREIRKATVAALQAQLETGRWIWSDLEKRREALAEAMEETLAGTGRRVRVNIADIVPDELSAKAITEKRALLPGYSLPPAPVDSPMIDKILGVRLQEVDDKRRLQNGKPLLNGRSRNADATCNTVH